MSNEKVIQLFLNREKGHTPSRYILGDWGMYKGQTLTSNGDTLINYNTKIAEWKGDTLYLNNKKYSITTSKIQNKIRYLAHQKNIDVIECQF